MQHAALAHALLHDAPERLLVPSHLLRIEVLGTELRGQFAPVALRDGLLDILAGLIGNRPTQLPLLRLRRVPSTAAIVLLHRDSSDLQMDVGGIYSTCNPILIALTAQMMLLTY